jgi:hypothetical protein
MIVIPQDVAARALFLSSQAVGDLSDGHQARGAEPARARLLAFGVLRRMFRAAESAAIARALGMRADEIRRASARYSVMCSTQRRKALDGVAHWHTPQLEARIVRALRAGDDAKEDAPRVVFTAREPRRFRACGTRVVAVEIFDMPKRPAVSGVWK